MADMSGTVEINPARVENPVLAHLHAYWQEKCGDRAMPAKGDIRPSDLRDVLGSVILTDVLPGYVDFRYRLIGTWVARYFNDDYTGKTVREAFASWPNGAADAALRLHRKCARDRVVILAVAPEDWLNKMEAFHSLYLPLSDDGETCNVVLNGFVFDRDNVRLARKLFSAARS
jgi:hypothetical protein